MEPMDTSSLTCLRVPWSHSREDGHARAKWSPWHRWADVRLEFIIGTGLIGLRGEVLTDTRGTACYDPHFPRVRPLKGDIPGRKNGALMAMDMAKHSLPWMPCSRAALFLGAGVEVTAA